MTLEEAKDIVHRIIRNAHMKEQLPIKWTDKIELAHRIVREDGERILKEYFQETEHNGK